MTISHRGFTLLIAMILVAVILAVSAALSDITYKQVVLSSTAQQSQNAFYNADSALECGLFQDQHANLFGYSGGASSGSFSCQGQNVTFSAPFVSVGSPRTTTFSIPCDSTPGDAVAQVVVVKQSSGATTMYAQGYSTCLANDPRRIERGEKATY